MASQGRPTITADDQRRIQRMSKVTDNKSEIARTVGVSRPTVYKYGDKIGQTTRGNYQANSCESDDSEDDDENYRS